MSEALKSPPKLEEGSHFSAAWQGGKGRFLIDGFPRKLDQAHAFDDTVSLAKQFYQCDHLY